MVNVGIAVLCLWTDMDCFRIELVHVVDEGEVVIGMQVSGIKLRTKLQMLDSCIIPCHLKVGKTQIVLQLCIVWLDLTWSLKSFQGLRIVPHLVKSYSKIEIPFIRLCIRRLQIIECQFFKFFPLLFTNEINSLPLKPTNASNLPLIILFLLGLLPAVLFLFSSGPFTLTHSTTLDSPPGPCTFPWTSGLIQKWWCLLLVLLLL